MASDEEFDEDDPPECGINDKNSKNYSFDDSHSQSHGHGIGDANSVNCSFSDSHSHGMNDTKSASYHFDDSHTHGITFTSSVRHTIDDIQSNKNHSHGNSNGSDSDDISKDDAEDNFVEKDPSNRYSFDDSHSQSHGHGIGDTNSVNYSFSDSQSHGINDTNSASYLFDDSHTHGIPNSISCTIGDIQSNKSQSHSHSHGDSDGSDSDDISKDDDEENFVEKDPSGRYGRYAEVLGKGAAKIVYRAYDMVDCKEVAWNKAKLKCEVEEAFSVRREVRILQLLNHKSILRLSKSWIVEDETINFITELCSSTLSEYRHKHKHISRKAVVSWGRQILQGLVYLHSHDPPIIHRDIKCDNILVKCRSSSSLKIGDFGTAIFVKKNELMSTVVGTPEFMAPEMYEQNYNELVDVYSFGMCMLELLTDEFPYSECVNLLQVYKKITSGEKPKSLEKVKDSQALDLIKRCLLPASQRPSAAELLTDPFLQCKYTVTDSFESQNQHLSYVHQLVNGYRPNKAFNNQKSDVNRTSTNDKNTESSSRQNQHPQNVVDQEANNTEESKSPKICFERSVGNRQYIVTGKRQNENILYLKIRVQDSGRSSEVSFQFDLSSDTADNVAEEMVRDLEYPPWFESDVIAGLINQELSALATNLEGVLSVNANMNPNAIAMGQSQSNVAALPTHGESSYIDVNNNKGGFGSADSTNETTINEIHGSAEAVFSHANMHIPSPTNETNTDKTSGFVSAGPVSASHDDINKTHVFASSPDNLQIGSSANERTTSETPGFIRAGSETALHDYMHIGASANETTTDETQEQDITTLENGVMCTTLPEPGVTFVGKMKSAYKSSAVDCSELEASMADDMTISNNYKPATRNGINSVKPSNGVLDFNLSASGIAKVNDHSVHRNESKTMSLTRDYGRNMLTDIGLVYIGQVFSSKKNRNENMKFKFNQANAGIGILLGPSSEQGIRRPVTSSINLPAEDHDNGDILVGYD